MPARTEKIYNAIAIAMTVNNDDPWEKAQRLLEAFLSGVPKDWANIN